MSSSGGAGTPLCPFVSLGIMLPMRKLLSGTINYHDVGGFNGSNEVIQCTTSEIDRFVVAAETKGNGDQTVYVIIPGQVAAVKVAAAGAAAIQGPVKIGGTAGQVTDQGAAVNANKVVGWSLGKQDPTNKTNTLAAGAAGDYVLLYIKPWTAVTT